MKKLLVIVVLGLLWCNTVNAGLKQPGPGEDNDISCITGALDAYKEAQEYLIKNPKNLQQKLLNIAGVIEVGIFTRKPDIIYKAKENGKFDVLT